MFNAIYPIHAAGALPAATIEVLISPALAWGMFLGFLSLSSCVLWFVSKSFSSTGSAPRKPLGPPPRARLAGSPAEARGFCALGEEVAQPAAA
jgi:hypothetical protein